MSRRPTPCRRRPAFPLGLSIFAILISLFPLACAEKEASVSPGVNKEFEGDVDVQRWVERLEGESREIYHHRKEIVQLLHLRPGVAVADIGAGTGFFSMMFARVVSPGGRVFAVDISDEFVQHIRIEAKREGLRNIETVQCTADSVRLRRGSIDVAFICDTYHHFEYPRHTLRSLHRAMKPGEELFVVDFKRIEGVSRDWVLTHVRAGAKVFRSEIEAAGFESVALDGDAGFLEENYVLRFRRKP